MMSNLYCEKTLPGVELVNTVFNEEHINISWYSVKAPQKTPGAEMILGPGLGEASQKYT